MLIGIVGSKRSGKDSIADILSFNYYFRRYAYADPIKDIIKIIFHWDDERIEDKETIDPYWGISPRQALQNIGTELFQFELGNNLPLFKKTTGRSIWVKSFEIWYKRIPFNDNAVVSDVRFQHELDSLKKLKAKIIKVERPSISLKDEHCSEQLIHDFKEYDHLIINDGGMVDLHDKVKAIMEEYNIGQTRKY